MPVTGIRIFRLAGDGLFTSSSRRKSPASTLECDVRALERVGLLEAGTPGRSILDLIEAPLLPRPIPSAQATPAADQGSGRQTQRSAHSPAG